MRSPDDFAQAAPPLWAAAAHALERRVEGAYDEWAVTILGPDHFEMAFSRREGHAACTIMVSAGQTGVDAAARKLARLAG